MCYNLLRISYYTKRLHLVKIEEKNYHILKTRSIDISFISQRDFGISFKFLVGKNETTCLNDLFFDIKPMEKIWQLMI